MELDVLEYVAYALEMHERTERAENALRIITATYTPPQQNFLTFVLTQYVDHGIDALDFDKLVSLLGTKYGSVQDGVRQLGSIPVIRSTSIDFQRHLYRTC